MAVGSPRGSGTTPRPGNVSFARSRRSSGTSPFERAKLLANKKLEKG